MTTITRTMMMGIIRADNLRLQASDGNDTGTIDELKKLGYAICIINNNGYIWWYPQKDTQSKTIYSTIREATIACIDDNKLNVLYPE
jgi:exosome complex RNA-binding protein Rrp4